jgi:hypothetical protein
MTFRKILKEYLLRNEKFEKEEYYRILIKKGKS